MTSQPEAELRASAMNALAHGAEPLYTPFANPVATMAALRGASLLSTALDADRSSRDCAALALGSLLCAYALDSGLFALHHVICQSLVRVCATPHAETNAAMLPHTMGAMRGRAPEAIGELAGALGVEAEGIEARIAELGGGQRRLEAIGASRDSLSEVVRAALARPELQLTPSPPDGTELTALLESAW
jgi:maleylacetate reductase